MAGSLNKVMIIGNVGQDPEIRSMQSGDRVANLSVATSESWKDKSGERQEKTQWHKVVIFNQNVVGIVEKYVSKGSKIFVEGQIESRKWEKDGIDQYITEIVVKPFNGGITLLDSKGEKSEQPQPKEKSKPTPVEDDEFEESIPF